MLGKKRKKHAPDRYGVVTQDVEQNIAKMTSHIAHRDWFHHKHCSFTEADDKSGCFGEPLCWPPVDRTNS